MRKSILIISLMTVVMAAFAINYPTYKPSSRDRQMQGQATMHSAQGQPISGYSTVATGGTTTTGEGSAIGGPRRTTIPGSDWGGGYDEYGFPNGASEGDVFTDESGTYIYSSTQGWVESSTYVKPGDIGQSDQAPIGSPIVMLLFAAMAAAVIAVRRHRALAVVALLFVCGQGWAYEFGTSGGNVSVTWAQGESFTLVLPDGTQAYQFQKTDGMPGYQTLDAQASRSVVITASQISMWTFNDENEIFQWQDKSGQWQHGSKAWVRFSTTGKQSATNEFPIPDKTGYTTLTITLDGSGNSVFTWSGGSDPAPTPGDHKIDGCDGCFLVEE